MMIETFVLLKPCPADFQVGGRGEPLKATESELKAIQKKG
jgi:hypothetical protein